MFNKLKMRSTDYLKVLDKLLPGPREVYTTPVGFNCNHDCIMCWRRRINAEEREAYIKSAQNSLGLSDYKRMLKQLSFRTRVIEVTGGGEPLLHPQIFSILKFIKENGFRGRLVTNGALLTSEFIRGLIDIKWNLIRVSFHTGNRKSYTTIHGKDDFKNVCRAIKSIIELRERTERYMRVCLSFVIQKANFDKIIEFSSLAERLGVDEIKFDNLIPLVPETLLNEKQMRFAQKSLRKVAESCQALNNASALVKIYDNLYSRSRSGGSPVALSSKRFFGKRCSVITNMMFITHEGNVRPCWFLTKKMGNIKTNPISKIWHSDRYRELRRRLNSGQFEPECYAYCPCEPES